MTTARIGETTIAESDTTERVEGNHYFPPNSVNQAMLEPSEHHTVCGWKGQASYYHVVVDGQRYENAAWYYPEPKAEAAHIKNHVAFYPVISVSDS
ncbi:MAG: DUF427 domain-containing protein [Myxococcota bacterium]